jgi:class 3 adenylate cyclase
MVSTSEPTHGIDDPLYNSRLIKNYVEYVKEHHPQVDIDLLLNHASIKTHELEDQGHWFSQRQIDRFHERLAQKTGDPNISRKVGRYAASSKAAGVVRQYALGFMTPAAAYWVLEKIGPHLTRASRLKTRRLGRNKIEVLAVPNPGVSEKPYQCDNRMGMLEAVSKLFTNKFAKIEHPLCMDRGGDLCRYIITWETTPAITWRRLRNYLIFIGLAACGVLQFSLTSASLAFLLLLMTALVVGVSFYSQHLKKEELTKNIESQRDAARLLLDEINLRYNNAQLIKEIGQATSMFLDIQKLLQSVVKAMEKRLDFDRGGIWLTDREKTHLVYNIGYGYEPEMEKLLKNTEFHLDKPSFKGVAVKVFREQSPLLVDDISGTENDLSESSLQLLKRMGAKSFVCAPIVYEKESLGVVLVDNVTSKRSLRNSDVSILMGIAPQIGISIHNAMSYQKLQESKERERSIRKLFEKYVPAPIIKKHVDSREVDLFQGEETPIVALFLDIRDFTSRAETMDARDVVSFLNEFFEKCSLVIGEENGHINKYTGDGFLAIFEAPGPVKRRTSLAFNAACRILEFSRRFILGGQPMEIGIGLHSGKAILGNIGSQNKIEYTAVGDTVNTAARLQEFTKIHQGFPLIMSRVAWEELADHPHHGAIRNLGKQKIRGKKEMLEAFGFTTKGDLPISAGHGVEGLIPLHRIKGV